MQDTVHNTKHMDLCQGEALFTMLQNFNFNNSKGQNMYKLFSSETKGRVG